MEPTKTERVWIRGLPGGGFAAIDVRRELTAVKPSSFYGALVVERRSEIRRAGHVPPVVAEAEGASVEAILTQLLPTAQSNPALGEALLRRAHAKR